VITQFSDHSRVRRPARHRRRGDRVRQRAYIAQREGKWGSQLV